ncbi:hypothetical protein HanRHA438_Chr12g0570951 [Helianthus annuus]|uniref:Uncharacterized protein n=1 Tax=Helianthus annuus TaxID=4232 RepID=A0A251T5V1_HELAN|nr:hypothetical protein HanXRQr2_Chr12g0559671 [Helianthus annuus]KAJ0490710.1 hypothetical protein HanHA300_Chr12g0458701 [Helianthus annuus]KAJ0506631.1 hypothetical protein HanHA89_Chr12g0484301 [Helianthus annuus]KAJ0676306.1 hypothetical protein HanLR1_Chr12g0461281 [Helianthus annuus]KAJ0679524.1 hypothetical protein HanOQP8_Chr12g0460571 [Helianthus annuus]
MKALGLKDESGGGGSKMDQEMSSGSGSKPVLVKLRKLLNYLKIIFMLEQEKVKPLIDTVLLRG